MDPRLDRLFSSLEAQFGAAVARAEEEAATDLALSLRQDLSTGDLVGRGGWVVSTPLGSRPVCEVAKDHLRLGEGDEVIPLASASLVRGAGRIPDRSENTLVQVLRASVRAGRELSVELEDQTVVGRPLACGATHLLLAGRAGELLLPIGQMRMIKFSRGG